MLQAERTLVVFQGLFQHAALRRHVDDLILSRDDYGLTVLDMIILNEDAELSATFSFLLQQLSPGRAARFLSEKIGKRGLSGHSGRTQIRPGQTRLQFLEESSRGCEKCPSNYLHPYCLRSAAENL